jgi:integrase/recombinase XerD
MGTRDPKVTVAALDYILERRQLGVMRPVTGREKRYTLFAFAECIGDPPVSKLRRRHVVKFLGRDGQSDATRRHRYSVIKVFLGWLRERGMLAVDPMLTVPVPREPRRLPKGLTHKQIAAILNAAPDTRARLIVLLGVQEGLRRGEISRLDHADVDAQNQAILVHGKGGHERLLPLSDETLAALNAYLREYPATIGPVIRSYVRPDRGVEPGTIYGLVRECMKDAGVKVGAFDGKSTHALRHTMAGDLLRNGAHVRDVQAALGHASLQTTQVYMPLVVGNLRDAMGGREYT